MNTVNTDTTSNTKRNVTRVAVIGAGITGLASAYRLTRSTQENHRFEVSVFESSDRVGGIINTRREKEYTIEDGPDSFITMKSAGIELAHELGLKSSVIKTNPNFRRAFIAWNGLLEPIPDGFNMIAPTRFDKLFASKLFSRTGKLRMAIEQFIPKGPLQSDESVASFVRRRYGKEALTRIGQPLIGGIYTADPETLSLRASVPKYLDYEQRYGSVTKGMLAEQKNSKNTAHAGARYSAFVSFDRGMSLLIETLSEAIGNGNIHRKQKVTGLHFDSQDNSWEVRFGDNDAKKFDQIILTTPSFVTAELIKPIDSTLSEELSKIDYASSAVINFVFDREQIHHPLDGFGFVVPAKENRQMIAGSFNSVKFTTRCAEDKAIVRVFLGGAMDEETLKNDDSSLVSIALADLKHYIKITGEPHLSLIKRYENAMPQYKLNHHLKAEKLDLLASAHKGMYLAGAYLNGVGIPDCIASANKACASLIENLDLSTSH